MNTDYTDNIKKIRKKAVFLCENPCPKKVRLISSIFNLKLETRNPKLETRNEQP